MKIFRWTSLFLAFSLSAFAADVIVPMYIRPSTINSEEQAQTEKLYRERPKEFVLPSDRLPSISADPSITLPSSEILIDSGEQTEVEQRLLDSKIERKYPEPLLQNGVIEDQSSGESDGPMMETE